MEFDLQGKSFKSDGNDYWCLVCLITLVYQLLRLLFFLAGNVQLICWLGTVVLTLNCISVLVLSFFKIFSLKLIFDLSTG